MGEYTKRSGLLKMTWETFLKAGCIALKGRKGKDGHHEESRGGCNTQ